MSSDYGLKRGTVLGPYRIIRLIGRGGMGEVYEAFEEGLNRRVAIKMILKEHLAKPDVKQRFEVEGRALASIIHPNVVTVHSLSHYEGSPYLAMEFVEGVTLSDYLQKRVFPVKEAVPLFKQLLTGVEALHNSKIIHRDLKPNNIIYQSNHVCKIVDFGVAKMFEEVGAEITGAGMVVGSAKYISPEGARGEPVTFQSDIWSLGVLFYQMLIGHTPFEAETYLKVLDKVQDEPIRMPMFAKMMIPQEIRSIILHMLQRDLSNRYTNTTQIIHQLDNYIKTHQKDFRKPRSSENLKTLNLNIKNEKKLYTKLKKSGYDNFRTKMILTIALNEQAKIDSSRTSYSEDTVTSAGVDPNEITISDRAMREAIAIIENSGTRPVERRKRPRDNEPKSYNPSSSIFLKVFFATMFVGVLFFVGESFFKSEPKKTSYSSYTPPPKNRPVVEPSQLDVKKYTPPQVTTPTPLSPQVSPPTQPTSQPPRLAKLKIKSFVGDPRGAMLNWGEVKGAKKYQVVISKDKNFKNYVVNKFVPLNSLKWAPPSKGEFYWKVQAWNKDQQLGDFSLIGQVSVFLGQPKLKRKYASTQPILSTRDLRQKYSISRSFPAVKGASAYQILASRSKNFSRSVKKTVSKKPQFDIQLNKEGKYYIKVAALDSRGRIAGSFSRVSEIQFIRRYKLMKPLLLSPGDGLNLQRPDRRPASTTFTWDAVELATKYEIQFSASKEFYRPFITEATTKTSFEISNNFPTGTVYWRVRSWRGKSKSYWTSPRRIIVPPGR